MEAFSFFGLPFGTLIVLFSALLFSIAFEAVNGFHDTANAVATVIYTNSLKPRSAVLLSGVCNFIGVYLGGIGVAFAIIHLLPIDLLVNTNSTASIAMIFAVLISAIMWNVGTWYFGLPASSSHTLIGAIVGVSIAYTVLNNQSLLQGLYLGSFKIVFLSLLISPVLGFVLAAFLLSMVKRHVHDPEIFDSPHDRVPPLWVRSILMCTSAGVSLAHGSNDGQKGVGLIMIILIGILPTYFALNPSYDIEHSGQLLKSLKQISQSIEPTRPEPVKIASVEILPVVYRTENKNPLLDELNEMSLFISKYHSFSVIDPVDRLQFRKHVLLLEDHLKKLEKTDPKDASIDKVMFDRARSQLRSIVDYAPSWVILIVALSLSVGTLVGWKRIVITVGEKIGKSPLTYAQGASSELVAALTIGVAAVSGLPVSTTHVLSSGVTGTMVASKTGVNETTVKNILLAWVLTLPVSVLLSAAIFTGIYCLL
jgi:PiT family inorganic phosphate transporter